MPSSKRLLALAGDAKLVEQIRRGNELAFEVAFERHGAGILGFCRHMLGSPEEAEDAVQHTFAAAFGELQRGGQRELALKPWLYAIARNRCVSLLRSRREHATEEFELATTGLAEEVERRAELRELLRDLLELPQEHREALLLSEAGDLSHAEVAEVLGCGVAKVKALVFRARTGLIQRRAAREAACSEIREQLANLRGGSLRRSTIRHHLRRCAGCRAYREQVRHQRRMLAAALPVVPSLGLKSSVLGAMGLGGGSAGGGLAAGLAGLAGASAPVGGATVAKVALVGVLAVGGAAAGKSALDERSPRRATEAPVAAAAPGDSVVAPGDSAVARAERSAGRPGASAQGDPVRPGRRIGNEAKGARNAARVGPRSGRAGLGAGGRRPVRDPRAGAAHPRGGEKPTPPGQLGKAGERGRGHAARGIDRPKTADTSRRGPVEAPRTGTANGRGPVEAPPAATPVRRGPPEPKPPAEKPANAKSPAAAGAAPAAAPAPEQLPQPKHQEKAPKG